MLDANVPIGFKHTTVFDIFNAALTWKGYLNRRVTPAPCVP